MTERRKDSVITRGVRQVRHAGRHVFDDGRYVSLGKLKGNKGSQNYARPEDADLARYTGVSMWCDRFDGSFGAAGLAAAQPSW